MTSIIYLLLVLIISILPKNEEIEKVGIIKSIDWVCRIQFFCNELANAFSYLSQ